VKRTRVRVARDPQAQPRNALLTDVEDAVGRFSAKEDVAYAIHAESDRVIVATFEMDEADGRLRAELEQWMAEFGLCVAD